MLLGLLTAQPATEVALDDDRCRRRALRAARKQPTPQQRLPPLPSRVAPVTRVSRVEIDARVSIAAPLPGALTPGLSSLEPRRYAASRSTHRHARWMVMAAGVL